MIIKAEKNWEVQDYSILNFSAEKNVRRYSYVEISTNSILFHVDVYSKSDDNTTKLSKRYIHSQTIDVMSQIIENNGRNIKISLQKRRNDNANNEYTISTITEIIIGTDKYGHEHYIYKCLDGTSYIDSLFEVSEKDIMHRQTKYHHKYYK